jgi:hypothetical protein
MWSCITAIRHLYGLRLIKHSGSATFCTQACFWKLFQMDQSEISRVSAFKVVFCDVAGVPPLRHHLQGVTHHYTTVITDPYQRPYNNPMPTVEMLGVSLHSRG